MLDKRRGFSAAGATLPHNWIHCKQTNMNRPLTLALLLCASVATAQTNVMLQIDHMVGAVPFGSSVVGTNNNGQQFNTSRLEYYISEIALIHDGGQVSPVPSTWVLVNGASTTTQDLGSFSITSLEGVRFGIGVEPSANHLDPALYPASHPLAPKSPSMHWGWTAGYRFVAMEGASGTGLNQNYEIHALGDANYFIQTIPTAGVLNGNTMTIRLIGNYAEALRDVGIASGPIVHGETGIARDLLTNFSQHVFTSIEGNGPVGVDEVERSPLVMFPNPTNGSTRVSLVDMQGIAELRIIDAAGRSIQSTIVSGGRSVDIELPTAGVYHVMLLQEGGLTASKTLIRY